MRLLVLAYVKLALEIECSSLLQALEVFSSILHDIIWLIPQHLHIFFEMQYFSGEVMQDLLKSLRNWVLLQILRSHFYITVKNI
jgi:hypothetical protein